MTSGKRGRQDDAIALQQAIDFVLQAVPLISDHRRGHASGIEGCVGRPQRCEVGGKHRLRVSSKEGEGRYRSRIGVQLAPQCRRVIQRFGEVSLAIGIARHQR